LGHFIGVNEQEEWFALWREEVRILQEREDYSLLLKSIESRSGRL
jgi:hypothetical protein